MVIIWMASGAETFTTVWVFVHKGIARFIWLHTMIYMMTALLSVLSSPHTRSTAQISHIIKLILADILLWPNTRNSHFIPCKGWRISNNKIFCSFFCWLWCRTSDPLSMLIFGDLLMDLPPDLWNTVSIQ